MSFLLSGEQLFPFPLGPSKKKADYFLFGALNYLKEKSWGFMGQSLGLRLCCCLKLMFQASGGHKKEERRKALRIH